MNPPWRKHNWLLKGMGDEIGLLHIMPKSHPLLIKRIGTTLLDHVPGAQTVFTIVKLAKVDSDMLLEHRRRALYTMCLDR